MLLSIKEWGIFKGIFIGLRRILKCNPFNKHCGIDLVPTNLKGEHKWIF
jgi:putative component of membrane protein insertase Oxa1/YidC/SpoIIIJ protein YidD